MEKMLVTLSGGVKLYMFHSVELYQRLLNAGEAKGMGRDSTMTLDLLPEVGPGVSLEFPVGMLESVSVTRVETVVFKKGVGDE
jgi:hypothetical protein